MIAVFPAGGVLAALAVIWLGATASAGRHAKRRWLPRIRPCSPRHCRNPLACHAPACYGQRLMPGPVTRIQAITQADVSDRVRKLGPPDSITPAEWRAMTLRTAMPHLVSTTWLRDRYADHAHWAAGVWQEIRNAKREAGVSE